MSYIQYKAGYKYQLVKSYQVSIPIYPNAVIADRYIQLSIPGVLTIGSGYAWDGASGIAIDTDNFMRGSLVHDALYQLLREGFLQESYREDADKILRKMVKQDGMSSMRAWWVYTAVRKFGASSAALGATKQVLTAPSS